MIIINFFPGAMGSMVLKTIHAHWPEFFQFNKNTNQLDYSNHSARPDLFLANQSEILQSDYEKLLMLSTRPSLILNHNLELIPEHIKAQAWLCSIGCSDQSQITATFLFWVKSNGYIFDYINAKHNMDFYQSAFVQLIRFLKMPTYCSGQLNINFEDLCSLDAVLPVLDQVCNEYNLPNYTLKNQWYLENYKRSMLPVTLFSEIYSKFCSIFGVMQSAYKQQIPIGDSTEYTQFFNKSQQFDFCDCIDFFYNFSQQVNNQYSLVQKL